MKIRLIPMKSEPGAFEANARRVVEVVEKASREGVELAVFADGVLGEAGAEGLRRLGGFGAAAGGAREAVEEASRGLGVRVAIGGREAAGALPAGMTAETGWRASGAEEEDGGETTGRWVLEVNGWGWADERVYDGRCRVTTPEGRVLAVTEAFSGRSLDLEAGHGLVRTAGDGGGVGAAESWEARIWKTLAFGLKEYAGRCGFPGALVALSGGIDSAVVVALAVDALGAEKVSGVTLPSEVTSRETLGDALELARRLGVGCPATAIKGIFREAEAAVWGAGESLGLPDTGGTLTVENLQSRSRGLVAMGLSNRTGRMVLATGNRSEILTGYCTLYGDTCGGFAPIKDLYKTEVFRLARWRNGEGEVIPESIIARPPSAELREGQKDSDSLPPYETLDALLAAWLDGGATDRELAAEFPRETVEKVKRLVYRSEFKRRQGAPGVLLRERAGLPLVHGFG